MGNFSVFYPSNSTLIYLIENCKNTGAVSALHKDGESVGGILGFMSISSKIPCKVKACTNSGIIKSNGVTATENIGKDEANYLGLLVGGCSTPPDIE
jgi:hypothetical protein